MHLPRVAVITPTHNRWPHVCRAIDSVLGQTYPNVEPVIVDDGSTDRTSEHLKAHYGDRIRLLTKPVNKEKSAARNDGVRATGADLVCMCDSDDELTPDSVETRVALFLNDPEFNGVAYGISDRGVPFDVSAFSGNSYQGDVVEPYLRSPFIDNNCYLLSRENMLHKGMYRPELTNREDMELLIRLMVRLPFRFCGAVVAKVRRIDSSARSRFEKIIAQDKGLSRAILSIEDVARRLGPAWCRYVQYDELQMLARAYYKAGRYREFRKCAREIRGEFGELLDKPGRLLRREIASRVLSIATGFWGRKESH